MARKKIEHPGVYYVKRAERTVTDKRTGKTRTMRAAARYKWTDPLTGKLDSDTFTEREARTADTRARAMKRKSDELRQLREDIEAGKVKANSGFTVAQAVAAFFDDNPHRRPAYVAELRRATDRFEAWADSAGIGSVDEINKAALVRFAGAVKRAPKHRAVKGGRAGQYAPSKERRAPVTINSELTAAGTVLLWLRGADLLSRATPEDIAQALKHISAPKDDPDPLQPAEVRAVLRAAIERDADLAARARRGKRVGPPIAGFVAFEVLSGIRAEQARALTWDRVNFEGRLTITITTSSKTKRKRRMLFDDVTPKLRELLEAQAVVTGGKRPVWGFSEQQTKRARERLIDTPGPKKRGKGMKAAYGSPAFTWQQLRVTSRSACGAAQLMDADAMARHYGHIKEVAHDFYAGSMPSVSRDAESIEDALGIEAELDEIIAQTKARARRGLRAVEGLRAERVG